MSSPFESDPFAAPAAESYVGHSRKRPWSPRALGWISFVFSFLAGGVLLGLNYERLGQPEKKVSTIALTLACFAAFIGVSWVLPDDSAFERVLRWLNIGAAIVVGRLQKDAYSRHVERGGETASPWPVVGLMLGVAVLLAAAAYGLLVYPDSP